MAWSPSVPRRVLLERFAEFAGVESPSPEAVAAALRQAGAGAVAIWLAADPPPVQVDVAGRAAGVTLVRALPAAEQGPLP